MIVPIELHDLLVERLETLFGNYYLGNDNDEKRVQVYPQHIPHKTEEDDETIFPHILVKMEMGEMKGAGSDNLCGVYFIIATCDMNVDQQGYRDCVNIMNKIFHSLTTRPILGGKYRFSGDAKWELASFEDEETTYPYYFGGIETTWEAPQIRESEEARNLV